MLIWNSFADRAMLNQPISLSLGSLELVFASKNISSVGGELDTEQCAGVNEGL